MVAEEAASSQATRSTRSMDERGEPGLDVETVSSSAVTRLDVDASSADRLEAC